MGGRVPGNSSIPAVQAPSPGSEAAGTQPAPVRRPPPSPHGLEALTRREAPEPAQMRPHAALPPRNAHALPPPPAAEPRPAEPLVDGPWMRGASSSRPSLPTPLPLPLPGEAPAPLESMRAPHRMQWPDGRQSAGTVQYTAEGPVFEVASRRHDGVLAERGQGKPAKPRDVAPGPLPVVPLMDDRTGQTYIARLPMVLANRDFDEAGNLKMGQTVNLMAGWERGRLVPEHVETLRSPNLMVLVAGSGDCTPGIAARHDVALKHLFGRSLEAVAGQCHDPQAVRNVAQALQAEDSAMYLRANSGPGVSGRWGTVQASFDARTAGSRLARLEPGQHWHIRIQLHNEDEESGHAMGIAIQRLSDEDFRISLLNSNGWEDAMDAVVDSGSSGIQHVYRTVDMKHAVAAMEQLLNGPAPPASVAGELAWTDCSTGRSLAEWLSQVGPPESEVRWGMHLDVDRDETGQPTVTTLQKGGDCIIEAQFAFMASALQPADYKLAKAACLNTLVQLADRLEPPGTTPANSDLQVARRHLQERITSSLSGHMVAPQTGPAGSA